MSHNCAGWSLYGALGDEDLYFGEYQNEGDLGYNRKPSRGSDKSSMVRIKSISWMEVRKVGTRRESMVSSESSADFTLFFLFLLLSFFLSLSFSFVVRSRLGIMRALQKGMTLDGQTSKSDN